MIAGQKSENESQGQSELEFNSGDESEKYANNVKGRYMNTFLSCLCHDFLCKILTMNLFLGEELRPTEPVADLDDITEVDESNLSSASFSTSSVGVVVTEIDLRHKGKANNKPLLLNKS